MISVTRKSRKNIRACCIDVGNKSLISRRPHGMDVTARVVRMLNLVSWASTFHADLVPADLVVQCALPRGLGGTQLVCLPSPGGSSPGRPLGLGKGFGGFEAIPGAVEESCIEVSGGSQSRTSGLLHQLSTVDLAGLSQRLCKKQSAASRIC